MEINPKYNIKDTVFFMRNNTVTSGVIYELNVVINTDREMCVHCHQHTEPFYYKYFYKVCVDLMRKDSTGYMIERDLYISKEELIKSL